MNTELKSSDEELKKKFFALKNKHDICALLEIDIKTLIYILYRKMPSTNYSTFTIQKRSGGLRVINAPSTSLRILQQKLNYIFQLIGMIAPCAHGYIIMPPVVKTRMVDF